MNIVGESYNTRSALYGMVFEPANYKESPAKHHPPNGYAIIDCGHIPRLRLTVTRFTGSVFLHIRASLKTQQKLFILHPTDLRRPYKLVVMGANTIGVLDFSPTYYQGIPP